MKVIIYPSKVSGSVTAAASKSAMQRACALALIKNGNTYLRNPGKSNDDVAALDVIEKLGARIIRIDEDTILIKSKDDRLAGKGINCGESGLGLRMFTPLVALEDHQIVITGSGSLASRPMHFFDEVLPQLGVEVKSNDGKLPLSIKGPLVAKDITIDGSLSSQFLTGLMIAYASCCTKPVTISVDELKSKPYIDLTMQLMGHFGWKVEHENHTHFHFEPVARPKEFDVIYTVEADWSGAAFLLVAGAIAGKVNVKGLDINSAQADKKIMEALADSGAQIRQQHDHIEITTTELTCFNFDATHCPDLFPPLVALASFCEGESRITGVKRLKHKESDRAATLTSEFSKLGVQVVVEDDIMKVSGVKKVSSASVSSHHDHRIAMACAVAALRGDGAIEISDAEAVNKSYPDFYHHLQMIKTKLQIL